MIFHNDQTVLYQPVRNTNVKIKPERDFGSEKASFSMQGWNEDLKLCSSEMLFFRLNRVQFFILPTIIE
jgi:hypothetical protein